MYNILISFSINSSFNSNRISIQTSPAQLRSRFEIELQSDVWQGLFYAGLWALFDLFSNIYLSI